MGVNEFSFGKVIYAQNNQVYRLGTLSRKESFMKIHIYSHAGHGSGIVSIGFHYNEYVVKHVIQSDCSCTFYSDSSNTIYVKVPSGALNSMIATSNFYGTINVGYNVSLPSDASEIS